MSSKWGYIGGTPDAGLLQCIRSVLDTIGATFTAAITHKYEFDLRFVLYVSRGDGTTAEDADIGEFIEMSQCDLPGHHPTHR